MKTSRLFAALILAVICALSANAQGVKRVVVIKVDGLPGYFADRFVKERDPATGKSILPWFDEIFYKNGARLNNFYTRGISLSASSWSQLDTGQHLQIKGNIEYDRYTKHGYDYLYIVPYYVNYLFRKKADMAGTEVLDQMQIALLCDAFPYEKRYTSQQLYQRGNNWANMASGFANIFPRRPEEFLDEWTIGGDFLNFTINQAEKDIIHDINAHPEKDYFDYYTGYFDHVSHANNDTASRLAALKSLDRTIGRIWVAIQSSARADETAMILVSDHGFNSDEKVYSQGFNIVNLLASAAGGGHHVVTKQKMMLDYSLKPLYPLSPMTTNTSQQSFYLEGKSNYPTALIDLDGNERASLHLRQRDLNVMQILLQQLQTPELDPEMRRAAAGAFFDIIDEHRALWKKTAVELDDELAALQRWKATQDKIVKAQQKTFTPAEIELGLDKQARRTLALRDLSENELSDYRKYLKTLNDLLGLRRESFDPKTVRVEDLIAPGAMGDPNSVNELQNYYVGISMRGLTLNADKGLDIEKSFTRANYFDLFARQAVKSNVQPAVSNRPIDFTAVRVPQATISDALPADMRSNEDAIWLFGNEEKQALILSRIDADGGESYRYLPVSGLQQAAGGKTTFQIKEWAGGFPLKIFEDKDLMIPAGDRAAWLGQWHTDVEWLRATHKTEYSNAIIGLNEQIDRHSIFSDSGDGLSSDEQLIRRFRSRQRHLAEADMLIVANNHWNFNVQGFNPGGNHGSFFRVSTNSTLMAAGGVRTGIPRGVAIDEPYDGLSFVPTVFAMMGRADGDNKPDAELYRLGFRRFPGRVIKEFLSLPVAAK